jgi:two-component system sensor histidine kinase UhpB
MAAPSTHDVGTTRAVVARGDASTEARPDVVRAVGGPLFLALAYYVGAQVGFALTSPIAPQSVLWLPNSIVLAVLLVVPTSRWPLFLLAAFPAQLLVAVQTGAPLTAMTLLFFTNCADACLGASIVRRLSRGPVSFSDLRTTLLFVVFAATLSPVLLSFADAAITVLTGWGSDYWAAFTTRVRSNVLTHLIVVPPVVKLLTTSRAQWRAIPAHRYTEVFAALAGLLAATVVSFELSIESVGVPSRGVTWPFVLPFLLWLAVRFGPAKTGLGLFIITIVSSWNIIDVGVTAAWLEPAITRLQFLMTAMAIPLLCLASVIRERAAATEALRRSYDQIRELTARVSRAHEAERARIARELDDDVNQRAIALGLGLSGLWRRYPAPHELHDALGQMQRRTATLVERIRAVSRQLHPGELRRSELAEAVRGLCADVAAESGTEVTVRAEQVAPVADAIGLCMYRVLQEALRNAVTHGQPRRIDVTLRDAAGELELIVLDDGRGFDAGAARRHGGLGLIDVEDRVRLVGGSFVIEGQPHRGTRLEVRVPVGGSSDTVDGLTSR